MAITAPSDDLSDLMDPTQPPVVLAIRPALGRLDLTGCHLGLLDNSKPRSAELLRTIGSALAAAHHCTWELCSKADSRTIAPALRQEMTARFHAIVTGVGD